MRTRADIVVHTVASRGSVRIPAADLLIDGVLTVDPAVQSKGYFSVQFRGTELELTAGGFCGFIPINGKVAVDVQPKMPVRNLGRIFDVASLALQRITGLSRQYDVGASSSGPVIEFLAAELAGSLRNVVKRGLRKKYERRLYIDSYPRGRIDLTASVRSSFSRGRDHILHYSAFNHALDNPENRVLRAAGELIVRRLRTQNRPNLELVRDLAQMLTFFSGASNLTRSDLRLALANTGEPRNEADTEYTSAVEIAGLIINERSADIDRRGDDLDLTAVVVNFDILFEEYTRNILKIGQHRRAPGAVVLDGNKTGRKDLFDGTASHKAQPDVVIRSDNGDPLLIVEVKYKSSPDRSDINQAITYAASYRVNNVAIVHQAATQADAGMVRVGSIGSITLYRFGIRLDAENLEEEENIFISSMFSLAGIPE